MDKINSELGFYFGALILYVVSVVFGCSYLELFSNPAIIPSIFCFYFISVKGKINILFTISFLSFFIGEILNLISVNDFLIPSLICFIIPYLIVIYFFIQDFLFYLKKKKNFVFSTSFYIVLLFLIYLLLNMLSFFNMKSGTEFVIYIIYGVLLFIMGMIVTLIQFNFNNRAIFYMVLMVTSFIVSDLFYIFSIKMTDVIALKLISVISQQISYFLFVKYFIHRTNFKVNNTTVQI